MPELFNGAQYSSGWRRISRSDESNTKLGSEIEKKLMTMAKEFDKIRSEFNTKLKESTEQSKFAQMNLSKRIEELTTSAIEKDNELKQLTEENSALKFSNDELAAQAAEKDTEIKKMSNNNETLKSASESLRIMIVQKDEEIKRLSDENIILKAKNEILYQQLSDLTSKNISFIDFFFKKATNKKSQQNDDMHSID